MKLTNEEIAILKEILKTATFTYTRNFRCKKCGHIYEYEFQIFTADTENNFGAHVCRKCGENKQWEDVKIKSVRFKMPKKVELQIIEKV